MLSGGTCSGQRGSYDVTAAALGGETRLWEWMYDNAGSAVFKIAAG